MRRLTTGAFPLGLGLGGFVDGIVLNQIAQWHHVLSAPPGQNSARTTETG